MSYHDSAVDSAPLVVGKKLLTDHSQRSTAHLIGPQTFFSLVSGEKAYNHKFYQPTRGGRVHCAKWSLLGTAVRPQKGESFGGKKSFWKAKSSHLIWHRPPLRSHKALQ
jgi:hypothetical protein